MDVVVTGRHIEISEGFREHVADKLAKLEKHDHRIMRVAVEVAIGDHDENLPDGMGVPMIGRVTPTGDRLRCGQSSIAAILSSGIVPRQDQGSLPLSLPP